MCRSNNNHGTSCRENERLTIRAFCLRLSASNHHTAFPEALTLHYLPRISSGTLEINDAKIRPASAALVELHRARWADKQRELRAGDSMEAAFTSTDRVRVSDGVRFEVYMRDEKVLKGVFGRDGEEAWNCWKVECHCVPTDGALGVSAAEICVSGEGCGFLKGRVETRVRKKRWGFSGLEEIPEENESETDGCDCEEMKTASSEAEGWDEEGQERGKDRKLEMELEGVRWAVDLGIWVMCLGVGILVSRASPRALMRRRGGKSI